jgi:hypothetical protein
MENTTTWVDGFEVMYIDSFFCAPTVVVYGDTASAIIRDRTIAWMESVGFKGVSYRVIEVGRQWRGDLDEEHARRRAPWQVSPPPSCQ